ncbi:hypothetical protein HZY97_12630 [Sphingomonas sp. R-74633]|uniref:hypothetical protein n=1 Tax=Sphingomonas sp. R-74633 TaxID=2751188 RepID=UPI0015D279D1|nr:hypothetical protein [Sphingomonas sp. R-74633]NYT41609.1 hypothetical protein [Sphingomonas sp. R-74633]
MSDRLAALPDWKFAVIPATQLMACVIGVQLVFGTLLCTDASDPGHRAAAVFVWCLLAASLPIGFVAIAARQLRLAYLILLALMPVALAAQQWLLDRGVLSCDWV